MDCTTDEQLAAVPTVEQVGGFVQIVADPTHAMEVRMIPPKPRKPIMRWCRASELPAMVPDLQRVNGDGFNIYLGANPRKAHGLSSDENVALARCVFCEQDAAQGYTGVDSFLEKIATAGLPEPSAVLFSGHGVWAYWRLVEAVLDLATWTAMQRGLIDTLGTDPTIKNPERIVRLPGFWNCKPPRAWAWLHSIDTTRVYPVSMFKPAASVIPLAPAKIITPASDSHKLLLKRARVYVAAAEGMGEGGRNGACFRLAGHVASFVTEFGECLSEPEILAILADFNHRCTPPLDEIELATAVHSAMTNGTPREPKPPRPSMKMIRTESGMRLALEDANV